MKMKYTVIRVILRVIIGLEIFRFIIVLMGGCDYDELLTEFLNHGMTAFICYAVLQFYKYSDE